MTKELRFTSLQSIRPSTDRILLTLCHIPGLSSKATSPKKPSSILPAKKKKKKSPLLCILHPLCCLLLFTLTLATTVFYNKNEIFKVFLDFLEGKAWETAIALPGPLPIFSLDIKTTCKTYSDWWHHFRAMSKLRCYTLGLSRVGSCTQNDSARSDSA